MAASSSPQLLQMQQEVVVGVGDCRTAVWPVSALTTYALGSCIAVVAWDWKLRLGELLHVMLPGSAIDRTASGAAGNPFLYVDTGVPELLRRLEVGGASKSRLRCCMAGGPNMMADSASFEIGKRNRMPIKKAFWRAGIFVDNEDVGGNESHSVRLDLGTGQGDLRKGTAPGRVLAPGRIQVFAEGSGR
jgi:chemotaxis protein CheD